MTPEKQKNNFFQTKTPKNETQKFLKNLSTNIQDLNKTPTSVKNKFLKLNFEGVQTNNNNNALKHEY